MGKTITILPHFKHFFESKEKIEILNGNARIGKTYAACQKILIDAVINTKHCCIIYSGGTFQKDQLYNNIKSILCDLEFKYNQDQYRFVLSNGSTIGVVSEKDVIGAGFLKGQKYDTICLKDIHFLSDLFIEKIIQISDNTIFIERCYKNRIILNEMERKKQCVVFDIKGNLNPYLESFNK